MNIRWNLIKMWWMALIHKTEIWCSALDKDIFRNCSFGCASSWFLSFKLILYVCNLLSKWDEHSILSMFSALPRYPHEKEKAIHQYIPLAVLLLSPSSSALAIASTLYTHFFYYSLIRVFNSQRWWQWDRDSFCGLRCSHLIIIVESDPSKKIFHEAKKKRKNHNARTKRGVYAKCKDTSKHCAIECTGSYFTIGHALRRCQSSSAYSFVIFIFRFAFRTKDKIKSHLKMVRTKDHDRWHAFHIIYYAGDIRSPFMFRVEARDCVCKFVIFQINQFGSEYPTTVHNQNFRLCWYTVIDVHFTPSIRR